MEETNEENVVNEFSIISDEDVGNISHGDVNTDNDASAVLGSTIVVDSNSQIQQDATECQTSSFTFEERKEALTIMEEEKDILDRLRPSCSTQQLQSATLVTLPPVDSFDIKRTVFPSIVYKKTIPEEEQVSFDRRFRDLVSQISIEKIENLQLGFTQKAILFHTIQTAFLNIFLKICEIPDGDGFEEGLKLYLILENFKNSYMKFITVHLTSVFKKTKTILDEFFKNDEREMSHEFLSSLFFDTVDVFPSPAGDFQTKPSKVNSLDNASCIFFNMHMQSVSDSYLNVFSGYIYDNIKRAIEQRFIIAAYTLIYFYNTILQMAYCINLHKESSKPKNVDFTQFRFMITGILMTYSRQVTRHLFDPAEKFDYFFPLECSLIIQSTTLAKKLENPAARAQELSRLTSEKPTPESSSSSSGFFGFFKS